MISTVGDLDGKTYGGFGAPYEEPKMREVIRDAGGTGQFQTVVLGTAAYEALYAGQVDFTEPFVAWEGIEAELRGQPLKTFDYTDYGFPDAYNSKLLDTATGQYWPQMDNAGRAASSLTASLMLVPMSGMPQPSCTLPSSPTVKTAFASIAPSFFSCKIAWPLCSPAWPSPVIITAPSRSLVPIATFPPLVWMVISSVACVLTAPTWRLLAGIVSHLRGLRRVL